MHPILRSQAPRATLLRTTLALAVSACALPALAASPLEGHWVGVFDLGGSPNFINSRIGEKDGQLSGELILPAMGQGAPLALGELKVEKDQVRFQLPGPDGIAKFDGKLQGDTVAGSVCVAAKCGSFTFQRSLAPSQERDQRYLGAYRFPDGQMVVLSQLGDFPQLFYTDLKTGRYGAMFAATENTFYSGAGFLNPSVREISFRFENDASGKPARLVWHAAGQAPRSAARLALRTEEVTFKNGDVTLSGTVVLPALDGKKTAKRPAVVLTQMSSPAPRGAYALQAYYFAANGIAALMYDKRGVGASSGDWQKASMNDLADDAVAGIKLMAAHKEVAADKIGTWGHSQGGWLAPLAAVRAGGAAFVIAQAASAVPPAEQEIFRIENSMREDNFAEEDIKAAVAYQRLLMHWVVSGGEGRAELLAAARAGDKARWAERVELVPDTMRVKPREETTEFYRYDPLPDLAKLKAPVVYILGDADTFVPVHKSKPLFEQTLAKAGHKDYQVWMLPNAAHGLWEIPSKEANAFVNSRYWARDHYPRMTQWLRAHGLIKK